MEERLQKIIARAGIASRRTAEKMILGGSVSVNGKTVTELGARADPSVDEIRVYGKLISVTQSHMYLVVNKPRGCIVAMKDPRNRPIIADLVKGLPERVFPVGRLDYHSEGLLLMTNDGDFAYRIQHPKFGIPKTYRVKVKGTITSENLRDIKKGISLSDGYFKPLNADIDKQNKKSCWLKLTISEGRNRIIRRYLSARGFEVTRLIRTAIGDIQLTDMKPNEIRYLSEYDVKKLLNSARLQ